jgi:hypothetical protein
MSCMHDEWFAIELAREKSARMLAEAEERRLVRLAPRKSIWAMLRVRVARSMVWFAVASEREATRQAVRQKLEAPRHP